MIHLTPSFRSALALLAVVLLLAPVSLTACSRCSDPPPDTPAPSPAPAPPQAAEPPPGPVVSHPQGPLMGKAQEYFKKGDFREAIRVARAAFDEAYAAAPKAPETWWKYLKMCEAHARMESPQASACYERFFRETESIEMDDRVMATALRWRIIMALEEKKGVQKLDLLERLNQVEGRLMVKGLLPRHEQAYSAMIRGGMAQQQDDHRRAAVEFQRAVTLYKESQENDPEMLIDYLEKLALANYSSGQYAESLRALKDLEDLTVAHYGGIHPEVAVVRMKRINVLMDMGENQEARGEWDYVHRILGQFRKGELAPDVDQLYVETMIRLDVEGLL